MKNILIISPALAKGGMERQLNILLENYDRSKFDVTLALFRNKVEYSLPEDIKLINLNKKGKIDFIFLWTLFKLLKDKRWDIINSKISGVNEQVMFICALLNKKNLLVEIRAAGKKQHKYYKKMKFILSFFQMNNNFNIISNSQKAIDNMKCFLSSKINYHLIYNAVDITKFKYIPIEREERFLIGFVGRIGKQKNLELLITAVNDLQDKKIELHCYGDVFEKDYMNVLNTMVKKYNMKGQVTFFPSADNIEEIYNEFNLFVLPSHFEGTPNVLLEAMACESLCLISKGANSDNYLDKQFVFDTNDSKDLGNKIKLMMTLDDVNKQQICQNNRNQIKKNFSIQSMVEKYQELWEKVYVESKN